MTYPSDVIQANVSSGLVAVLIPRKKLVMLFTCPECKKVKMTKFTQNTQAVRRMMPRVRPKKSQCICGYIHYTKRWKH
jgi:hypothetical protein